MAGIGLDGELDDLVFKVSPLLDLEGEGGLDVLVVGHRYYHLGVFKQHQVH